MPITVIVATIGWAITRFFNATPNPLTAAPKPIVEAVAFFSAAATALTDAALAKSAAVVSRISPLRPFLLRIAFICVSLRVDSDILALIASVE